jgi:hypothetical protein
MTLEEARALILSFPEAHQEDRPDGVIFRVRRAFFTRPVQNDESLLVTHVPYDERDLLVELDPDTYHFDPRFKDHMVIYVRIASVLPGSLKRLLEHRWRVAASKRAQKAYDASA